MIRKGVSLLIVKGVVTPKPIVNLPPGVRRVRLRMRNNDVTRAFLRFDDRIEHHLIAPDASGNWKLADGMCQGINYVYRGMPRTLQEENARLDNEEIETTETIRLKP